MRLLIPVFSPVLGTWGGLTRVVAMAEAAKAAGHDTAFCASGQLAFQLRRRGYRVFAMPSTSILGLPSGLSRILERRSRSLALAVRSGQDLGNIWTIFFAFGLARGRYLRQLVEAERDAAKVFRADALFTDLDPGAYLLSRVAGLPIAAAYADVMTRGTGSRPWKIMDRAIASVLRSQGCAACTPEELFFGSSVLKIIPSIPELDGTDPAREDICYVGQLLGAVRPANATSVFVPDPERRYVFVYVGTGSLPLTMVREVLVRLCIARPDLSCVVGAQGIQSPQQVGQVHFLPYVHPAALLPLADWTICHGGQNTVIESLMHGVPVLAFPGPIFERRFNARMVTRAGAGFLGEKEDFTVEWLTASMAAEGTTVKAEHLGNRIRSYPGARGAIDIMTRTWGLPGNP